MGLYRREETGQWWCRFQVNGHEIRRSTRTGDRRRAEVEERRLRAYYEAQAPRRRAGRAPGLADLGGLDVERAVAVGVTNAQIDAIKYAWQWLVNKLGPDTAPASITHAEVQRYIAARRQDGSRGQTIVREVQALKRGLAEAHRRGWVPIMIMDWPKVRRDAPDPKQKGKLHPPAIIGAWLAQLEGDAKDEAELAMLTSLRAKELKRITAQWVEPAPDGSLVPAVLRLPGAQTKSRKERAVPLVQRALEIIRRRAEALPEGAPPDMPLLYQGSHKRAYRTAARKIGYAGRITLRDLRHTFATLAARGVGVDAVRDIYGHTDLAVTSRYITVDMARMACAALAVAGTVTSAQEGKMGLKWSGQPDSNRRPPAPKAGLLDVINHIAECGPCYEAAEKRLNLHVSDVAVGTGRSAQVAR